MNPAVTAGAVLALGAIAVAVVLALRLEHPWLQPWALARATVQLGVLSLILHGIISEPVWVAVFLVVMVVAAAWVVMRRLALHPRYSGWVLVTLVASVAAPTSIVFATGAVEFSPRYVLAVAGILIGNAMSVCVLMGRSLGALLVSQREEIEGWMSLGATPRVAALRAVRSAGSTALIPSTDQTRTTGIVTLPGAFVGAVFAGASPLEAAQFQLVVLAGILAVGALAVASFSLLFGAPTRLPLHETSLGG
jgi:putative ABC transport system permease protein